MNANTRRVLLVAALAAVAVLGGLYIRQRAGGPPGRTTAVPGASGGHAAGSGFLAVPGAPGEASSAIEGTVRDREGRALAGAVVVLVADPPPGDRSSAAVDARADRLLSHARTAAGGGYRLAPVAAGRYSVTASARGHLPASRRGVLVSAAAPTTDIDLVLNPGENSLSGRVLDAGGGAIAGARVSLMGGTPGSPSDHGTALAISERDGAYHLTLPEGRHGVMAQAEGYAADRAQVMIGGHQRRDFRLPPAAAILGRVVQRGSGAPVPGARVGARSNGPLFEVTTDQDGAFTVPGLEPGSYALFASAGPLAGRSTMPVVVGLAARVDGVVLEVGAGRTVSGRVRRSPGGAPVAGANLYLSDALPAGTASARPRPQVKSGADGGYRFEGLDPGAYGIVVGGPGLGGAHRTVTVAGADVTGIDLEVQDTGVVFGRVTDPAGRPAAAAEVHVQVGPQHAEDVIGSVHTDGDGKYRIADVPAGRLVVSARHDQHGRAQHEAGVIAAGQQRQVNLQLGGGARIHGRVSWNDGTPASGLTVTASVSGDMSASQATTGADGRYLIGRFPAGSPVYLQVELVAGWVGEGAAEAANRIVRVTGAGDVGGIDFTLRRSDAIVRGLVVGPDGRPLGGAVIRTRPGREGQRVLTSDDGAFVIEDLLPGPYQVFAEVAGLPAAEVAAVAPTKSPLRIQLEAGALVAGTVSRGSGGPVGSYTVWLQPAQDPRGRNRERSAVTTQDWVQDHNGAYELRGIAPGRYDLVASTLDGQSGTVPGLTLRAGEQRRGLLIRVGAGLTLKGRIVDLETGRPLTGVTVEVAAGGRTLNARSDASGAFQVPGLLAASQIGLKLDRPGSMPYRRSFNLPAEGEGFDLGDVPLLAARPERAQSGRVGMVLGSQGQGGITVQGALDTGPAARAGVRAGDVIVAIDGRSVNNADVSAVVAMVTGGDPGSVVVLELRAPGAPPRKVHVTRM